MYLSETPGTVVLTRLEAQSRRGQRPQKLQLGLQGDPVLVNHLQTNKGNMTSDHQDPNKTVNGKKFHFCCGNNGLK